jgi:hypothetical protein
VSTELFDEINDPSVLDVISESLADLLISPVAPYFCASQLTLSASVNWEFFRLSPPEESNFRLLSFTWGKWADRHSIPLKV